MKRPTPIITSQYRVQKKLKLIGRRFKAPRGLYFAKLRLEFISEIQQRLLPSLAAGPGLQN
jgi:hypothetical protein